MNKTLTIIVYPANRDFRDMQHTCRSIICQGSHILIVFDTESDSWYWK